MMSSTHEVYPTCQARALYSVSDCLCAVLNLYKLIKFRAIIGFVL